MQTKSGKYLHPIGIGTWLISGSYEPDSSAKYGGATPVYGHEKDEIASIRYSLDHGQNHIDCAELYGGFYTDEVVGKALEGYNREDLYIADKLWKTSLGTGLVRQTVEKMLAKLKVDYIDMLYIHWPFDDGPWREAIPQIDALIDEGIVRQWGVSNFSIAQMQEAMALSKYPLAANQMHFNVLYKDEVDTDFRTFCNENGIQLIAYQPMKRQEVLSNSIVGEIAKARDATPGQVALAWLLSKDALPIPKAVKKEHIDENLASVGLILTQEEIGRLDDI